MCLFMWQRGAFEGVAWGYGAHFYNSIDNFQLPSLPSRRFSIYTADFTVLLSFCLIYTFFFPVEEWFFETFPLAVRLLLLLRPVERRPRWNARKVDDKLPIDCSSPSCFVLSICSSSFAQKLWWKMWWTVYFVKVLNCLYYVYQLIEKYEREW